MNGFDDLIRSAEDDPKFWMQIALQEFVHSLGALMDSRRVTTRAELAEIVGVKAPTVSRWLNGNENLTVESMCRLAFALDAAVHIHVADKNDRGRWRPETGIARAEEVPLEIKMGDDMVNAVSTSPELPSEPLPVAPRKSSSRRGRGRP